MPEFLELLRELQGQESQVKFSARIGIDQGELSKLLSGRRRPARRTIVGLLRAFPARRHEITEALIAHLAGPADRASVSESGFAAHAGDLTERSA